MIGLRQGSSVSWLGSISNRGKTLFPPLSLGDAGITTGNSENICRIPTCASEQLAGEDRLELRLPESILLFLGSFPSFSHQELNVRPWDSR